MKKGKIFPSLAAALALAFSHGAVCAAEVTASVGATMIAPISLVEDRVLDFGIIAPTDQAGTVWVTCPGVRNPTGGVELVTGGTENSGEFIVSGEPFTAYSVTVPAVDVTISDGLGNDMTISDFARVGGMTDLGAGTRTFRVCATLNVAAGQAVGTYTGTYDVSVAYD